MLVQGSPLYERYLSSRIGRNGLFDKSKGSILSKASLLVTSVLAQPGLLTTQLGSYDTFPLPRVNEANFQQHNAFAIAQNPQWQRAAVKRQAVPSRKTRRRLRRIPIGDANLLRTLDAQIKDLSTLAENARMMQHGAALVTEHLQHLVGLLDNLHSRAPSFFMLTDSQARILQRCLWKTIASEVNPQLRQQLSSLLDNHAEKLSPDQLTLLRAIQTHLTTTACDGTNLAPALGWTAVGNPSGTTSEIKSPMLDTHLASVPAMAKQIVNASSSTTGVIASPSHAFSSLKSASDPITAAASILRASIEAGNKKFKRSKHSKCAVKYSLKHFADSYKMTDVRNAAERAVDVWNKSVDCFKAIAHAVQVTVGLLRAVWRGSMKMRGSMTVDGEAVPQQVVSLWHDSLTASVGVHFNNNPEAYSSWRVAVGDVSGSLNEAVRPLAEHEAKSYEWYRLVQTATALQSNRKPFIRQQQRRSHDNLDHQKPAEVAWMWAKEPNKMLVLSDGVRSSGDSWTQIVDISPAAAQKYVIGGDVNWPVENPGQPKIVIELIEKLKDEDWDGQITDRGLISI